MCRHKPESTYLIFRGSIAVQLVDNLTGLDYIKQENIMVLNVVKLLNPNRRNSKLAKKLYLPLTKKQVSIVLTDKN